MIELKHNDREKVDGNENNRIDRTMSTSCGERTEKTGITSMSSNPAGL